MVKVLYIPETNYLMSHRGTQARWIGLALPEFMLGNGFIHSEIAFFKTRRAASKIVRNIIRCSNGGLSREMFEIIVE